MSESPRSGIRGPQEPRITTEAGTRDPLSSPDLARVIEDAEKLLKDGGMPFGWLVRDLLAAVQHLRAETLNEATRLVDEERRRWYTALEVAGFADLEGLAPEVVASKVTAELTALRSENEELLTALKQLYALVPDCDEDYLLDGNKGEFALKAIRVPGIGDACRNARAVFEKADRGDAAPHK